MLIKSNVSKSTGRFKLYNLWWPASSDPLAIERGMIRKGGTFKKQDGEQAGAGMYHHFRKFQEITWPDKIWENGPFKNYWAEKCLEVYLSHTYIGVMGAAAAGKSDSFGCNALTDWYCHDECMTVMVSSTDLKSLELRIWGLIKKYHKAAKRNREWLPGHLIEGKQLLLQDPRSESAEGRDFKNGIIAVPLRKGNQFVGLGSLVGIHNKMVTIIADEANLCFSPGTMVDTPTGPVPIELLKTGDKVICAAGAARIKQTLKRFSKKLVRVTTKDGRQINCTPEHPFFTQYGWIKAGQLNQAHYILSAYEAMQILREGILPETVPASLRPLSFHGSEPSLRIMRENIPSSSRLLTSEILQSELLGDLEDDPTRYTGQNFHSESYGQGCSNPESMAGHRIWTGLENVSVSKNEAESSHEQSRVAIEDEGIPEKAFASAKNSGRKRDRPHQGRMAIIENVPGSILELSCSYYETDRQWISNLLQAGHSIPCFETWGGSGWKQPQTKTPEETGYEKGRPSAGAWVDRAEVFKPGDTGIPHDRDEGYPVHNIEVERHPSYSVSGLLVHNCPRAFLDSISNLAKCERFKLVALGNPNETTNAHGIICEPAAELGGWEGGADQTPGTKTWPTRFPDGICLQLPGSDSPNLKANEGDPEPFPFLVTRKQLQDDAKIWGIDDWHYQMMDEGKMPRGQGSRRVLTRQACVQFGAFKSPVWRDTRRTSIAFLDAAYRGVGGDRCVFGELQFGHEAVPVGGSEIVTNLISQQVSSDNYPKILALIDLVIVPISAGVGGESPEDQIVAFCKSQCEARGIPPENLFFDAGMRTSLVTAFCRVWSTAVNSVDCGGKASETTVSSEIKIVARDYYSKFVTELWFSVRYAVESRQFRGMTEEACTEFGQREWKMVSGNKIEIESKEEMKVKTGRSPDLADAIAVGVYGARRRGFIISKMIPEEEYNPKTPSWKVKYQEQARELAQSGQLTYQ